MAETNFYLKDSQSCEPTLINLCFHYEGNRFKYSTGRKVLPGHWNYQDQRVVRKSVKGSEKINKHLEIIRDHINDIYNAEMEEGEFITNDYLRNALKKLLGKETVKRKSFFECLGEFIEVGLISKGKKQGSSRLPNTIKKFTSLKNHLLEFESKKKVKLSFQRMDMDFYESFIHFLTKDKNLLNNSVAKYISALKTFLNWATKIRKYNTLNTYLEFSFSKDDVDIITLTESELDYLYSLDLKKSPRLMKVRDLFCFGCFTGLRFSDLIAVKKDHIKNGWLNVITKKTRQKLRVPLSDDALEILTKYDFQLPEISNQRMNGYLKELGMIANLNSPESITRYRGGIKDVKEGPKYEFLTSHTMRRTFVTVSLKRKLRAEVVMAITGHSSWKSFQKYINITDEDRGEEMRAVWNKKQSDKAEVV